MVGHCTCSPDALSSLFPTLSLVSSHANLPVPALHNFNLGSPFLFYHLPLFILQDCSYTHFPFFPLTHTDIRSLL